MVLCAIAMSALTVACDKDDDASFTVVYPPDEPARTPVTVRMTCNFRASSLMLRTLDMTLDYYDADGTLKTYHPDDTFTFDTVQNGDSMFVWRTTLLAPLAIAPKFGMRLNAEIKDGVDTSAMESRTIKFYRDLTYSWGLYDSVGQLIGVNTYANPTSIDVMWRKLDSFLHMHSPEKGIVSNGVIFSTDGTFTKKSSWPLDE